MKKGSKVKLTATEEKQRLDAWYAEEAQKLAAAVEEERQQALEAARKEEEKRLAAVAEEIKPLAIHCIDLAEKADKAIEAARLALIQRQQVADEIAQKSAKFPDRKVDARQWYYSAGFESGLNANGLLKLCRMSAHLSGRSFISQDVRNLSRWIDAKTMARASA